MATIQPAFYSTIIAMAQDAYASGILMYHPLIVGGVTITMRMFHNHNMVAVQVESRLLSASVYDTDSEQTQRDTIANLLADMFVKINPNV